MLKNTKLSKRAWRPMALAALAAGTLHASACTLGDIRHNIVGGTLGFVEGYTADLWAALVPSAESLVGAEE